MGNYNSFGATEAALLRCFPGTAAADYGGSTAIGETLARIARELAGAMTEASYRMLAEMVELELVEDFASAGQTTVTLGLAPYLAGTLHVWSYARTDDLSEEPVWDENELTVSGVSGQTVTLSSGLARGDRVFATYEIDPENVTFSWPSCADLVIYGAAAELGTRLFSEGTQQWELVKEYKGKYQGVYVVTEGGALARAREGTWVPDELRTLKFWKDIERVASKSLDSVRRYRG
jgi:hypothetical protein